jgi:AraC-like DNA-binding protein
MDPTKTFAINPGLGVLMTDLGIAPANVLRRAGLPGDLLARGPTALAPQEYFGLWQALEEEAGDVNLPLLIGRATSVEAFDASIFAALCSPNLNVAARRLARYKRLIGPMRLVVTQSGGETTLEYVWPEQATPPAGLAATELVFWVALARLGTRMEVRPVRVTTPEPPQDAEAYLEYFGVSVQRSPAQAVTFSAQDAARPFITANEAMWEFFEPELRRRLSELEADSSTAERIRAALLELLPAGQASMDAVARKLGLSTRTLQRRLLVEGTTFQDSLNRTREALARHYLSNSRMSAAEISFLLGYEDPNSFYRAFRTWTGQTPERVREASL